MAHGNFKDLQRFTVSDKVLRVKPFNFAKNLKYDKYFSSVLLIVLVKMQGSLFWKTKKES